MSTRSRIGILDEDGSVRSIYCHCDGYPEYNGAILDEFYNSKEKAEELIALGDISSLGETTEYREGSLDEKYTTDYHRWRDEPIFSMVSLDLDDYIDDSRKSYAEYVYLFADGCWKMYTPQWVPVRKVLKERE